MEDLKGRVAIITGASRGIGRVIALKLAREGVKIVLAAKTVEPNPKLPGTILTVAEEIRELGGEALPIQTDVRDEEQIKAMVDQTVEKFGRVDILLNNAGALWWYPVKDTPPNKFDLIMDVNVRGSFVASHYVLPHMMKQKWGHIINMSPPVDLEVLGGKVGYFISKFGMTMLALGLAKEVKAQNIGVNSLWPVTIIESLASINFGLGDESMWRKPEILADSVHAIVTQKPSEYTGRALLDEEVLGELLGLTDFDEYNCVEGGKPMKIVRNWDVEAGRPVDPTTLKSK